ncbi:hypothetical protein K1T71_005370, partial [Dendrolimus kikuchii]
RKSRKSAPTHAIESDPMIIDRIAPFLMTAVMRPFLAATLCLNFIIQTYLTDYDNHQPLEAPKLCFLRNYNCDL